jgi:thioredoxin-like negative regulator of GroEL
MVRAVPHDGAGLRPRRQGARTARFAKVNVDEEPAIAARFGIRGIPTLIAFEKGKVMKQHAGLVDLEFLRRLAH